MTKRVVLTQPASPAEQVPVEVIATSIKAIAEGVMKLRDGPLNDRALILLIQHAAPGIKSGRHTVGHISAKQIKAVLDGMASLEREYLKTTKPTK